MAQRRPTGRGSRAARDPSRPFLTPGASPLRRAVERRSAVALVFLSKLPRALPALAVLAILAGGIALPGWAGVVCLLLATAVLGWLLFLSWPSLPPPGRVLRLAAVGLTIGIAVTRLLR